MNDRTYLDNTPECNLNLILQYAKEGHLDLYLLELEENDRVSLVEDIYPELRVYNEDVYLAALAALGDKTSRLMKQLDDIRSGAIWKNR